MVSKSSGFLPKSSDLRLRDRKDQFNGTENIEDFLRTNEPLDDKLTKQLKKPQSFLHRDHWFHTFVCLALTVASFLLRFYKIDESNIVVWDEAHFGKFGSYYLKHEFYHDVHPPLGKMLIGLGEYLAGFDGDFDFSSNSNYPKSVNFKAMRQFNAIFSALYVAYGSQISMRSHGLSPGLLHSHPQTYPDGSNQRQVTGYGHRDGNNDWIVKFSRSSGKANIPSHVSKGNYEVSGYGSDTMGDFKDDWIIEIVEQLPTGNKTMENKQLIHPLTTNFRLKNKELGCYLAATGLSYPGWGYNQAEIVCKYPWNYHDKSTWWNIEDHVNSNLHTDDTFTPPPSRFWKDFVVINFAMASSNNALVPDLDKYDRLASEPWEWPTLHTGLRMCNWGDSTVKYYLLGSPFNTWLSTATLPILVILIFVQLFRYQRQSLQFTEEKVWNVFVSAVLSFVGWVLHYIPFLLMGRVTYVHHYVPALFFAIMCFAYVVDYTLSNFNRYLKVVTYILLYAGCVYVYWYFAPLCQGMPEANLNYLYLQLLPGWDVSNAQFS
ncbi:unnamed protein product [Kluyveromyces dobzhanskii CBS 2104]|uniref:Dolichyl-phosphate-mannose--protein mannosyltransferase n=1 Tax=Kluyveromyces dobzhanskii CBS 2104 TaxID=1427455 RepID=A0A0A8LDC2_9SACH|nr:unnamed protein product [Kluyveromyces dobzhanskii CBS 2104]